MGKRDEKEAKTHQRRRKREKGKTNPRGMEVERGEKE